MNTKQTDNHQNDDLEQVGKADSQSETSFKEAYDILKQNANALQQQDEPDIDHLMDLVEQSIAAYKVCQTRIDAVQEALNQTLANAHLLDDD